MNDENEMVKPYGADDAQTVGRETERDTPPDPAVDPGSPADWTETPEVPLADADENALQDPAQSDEIPAQDDAAADPLAEFGEISAETGETDTETGEADTETGEAGAETSEADGEVGEIGGEAFELQELVPPPTAGEQIRAVAIRVKDMVLQISLPHCIMRLVGIFLLISASFVVYHYSFAADHSYQPISNWQEFRDCISLPRFLMFVVGDYILLTLLKMRLPKTRLDSIVLIAGLLVFSLTTLWRNDNTYYMFALILIGAVSGYAALQYDRKCAVKKLPFAVTLILVILLAAFVAFAVAASTIYQYKAYGTSCFDMGIFVQMYHSMINDLSLVTTCERGEFLSHFAVHCSPIYYLLLPIYYFFPYAHTLLIAQAVMIAIGVFPLVGICKKYHFTNGSTLFFSITYLFCAELIGPCYYHFHENAFLPMLLMFLFLALEMKKPVMLYIFTVLVLCVKEDTPIYIVFIGLFLLFRKDMGKFRKHGAIMAVLGAIYFVVVTTLMGKYGEGVMTSRTYGNLMVDWDGGFGEIIKTVLLNPAYFISQLLREDTLIFFLSVMIPLGMMPLFSKKFSRLFLFVPFLLMNLASGYSYASNRDFQYVFGTATCLIYATVVNTADLRPKKRQMISAYTAMATLFMATSVYSGKAMWKYEYYQENQERFEAQDEALSSIPDDASVTCDTWFVPFLANRDEIYEMSDTLAYEPSKTDFVVVCVSESYDYNDALLEKLESEGYIYYNGVESNLEIYVSPTYEFAED